MHRRLWLLAGVGAAVLMLAASATATTKSAGSARGATLAAAPFAQSWANVPRTAAGRKAKSVLVFGAEQDVVGFNTALASENAFWGVVMGATPTIRGTYIIDNNAKYHLDLASKVTATKSTLDIVIRPDANWYWGGKKLPVTNADVVYTWKQIMSPNNDVAGRTGYDQITGYTLKGTKEVVFKWKKPFADYQDLFGGVYPSKALAGQDFNKIWSNCICGNDGKPVSDGPFYMSNYTRGQGVTMKANPLWYGSKAKLKEVDFKIITDTNSEIQAMRGGEVDAIFPSPQTALAQLQSQAGLVYNARSAYYQEHVDVQFGPKSNPLTHAPWFRHALMMGMDRPSLIKALYSQIAPGMKPLNNLEYVSGATATPHFAKWNFSQKKARDLLAKHCTGGPSAPTANNTAIWTCSGQKAELRWFTTAGNQRRATSVAIFTQQLKSIGIQLDPMIQPSTTVFGTVLPNHDYDVAEYAWTGSPDPSGFDAIWGCGGDSNYTTYCNRKVTNLFAAGDQELDPTKRLADYEQADALMANDIPAVPLYSQPSIIVYKKGLKGFDKANNPTNVGPTWNIENWSWS
jgi:peptide/nickel transport system substrate-binding protein